MSPAGGGVLQVPAPFGYERASSVQHALTLLEQLGPESRLLAGGHSLLPMMKLRLASPQYVIDIDPLADELGYIQRADGEIRIGAMTRHRALLESPLLAAARDLHRRRARDRRPRGPQPRHDRRRALPGRSVRGPVRGVRGGRRGDGDPLPRRRARRRMHEFHRGPYETAVGPAEMLIEIRVPLRATGSAYVKVDRRVGDWAVVAAGAALELEDGTIAGPASRSSPSAATSRRPRPRRRSSATADRRAFAHAAALAAAGCAPVTDQRGSASTSGTSSAS